MKNTMKSYLLVSLLAVFEIAKLFIFDKSVSNSEIILTIFWVALCFLSLLLLKFPKDNSQYKNTVTKTVIMCLLCTILVSYLLGLFVGFTKNLFSMKLINIFKNISLIFIVAVAREIIRYVVAKNCQMTKKPIVFLTIAYILFEIINQYTSKTLVGFESYFLFTCRVVVTTISAELMLSYLSYHFGIKPCLTYAIPIAIYPYVLPLIPDVGDFIYSTIFLLLPFLIYILTIGIVKYINKEKESYNTDYRNLFYGPIFVFLCVVVVLVSGVFRYKMIAIATGSMSPTYERGDAVIYRKIDDESELKNGMIIVYVKDDRIITHRINKIIKSSGSIEIKTKGDFNEQPDDYVIKREDVLGEVKYVVKYIGYPTVLLSEAF